MSPSPVGSLFLIGLPGPTLNEEAKRLLDRVRPGFIVVFGRNITTPSELARLVETTHDFLGYRACFCIDQEGGSVTRLKDGFTVAPSARAIAMGSSDVDARTCGEILGSEMARAGIRWDLAPVVDVDSNPENPGVGLRSFGEDPDTVVHHASLFLEGLRGAGVEGCLKHFPGLGRVDVDPHVATPSIHAGHEELDAQELRPFREIPAAAWMPTHVSVPALDPAGTPATLSRAVLTGLARQTLGFRGVLVADDFTMGGSTAHLAVPDAVVQGLLAGMDILTVCHDSRLIEQVFTRVQSETQRDETAGRRIEESNARVRDFIAGFPIPSAHAESYGDETFMEEIAVRAIRLVDPVSSGDASADSEKAPATAAPHDTALRLARPDLVIAPARVSRTPAAESTKGVPDAATRIARDIGVELCGYSPEGSSTRERDAIITAVRGRRVLFFAESRNTYDSDFHARVAGSALETHFVELGYPVPGNATRYRVSIASYGASRPQQAALLRYLRRLYSIMEER